jgi:uncharacterized protein YpiB (UPF0302 family)
MERLHTVHDAVISLLAEIFLDEALRRFKINQLYELIDEALDNGDDARFKELTTHLNQLLADECRVV